MEMVSQTYIYKTDHIVYLKYILFSILPLYPCKDGETGGLRCDKIESKIGNL